MSPDYTAANHVEDRVQDSIAKVLLSAPTTVRGVAWQGSSGSINAMHIGHRRGRVETTLISLLQFQGELGTTYTTRPATLTPERLVGLTV